MEEFWPEQDKETANKESGNRPLRSEIAEELGEVLWHTILAARLCYEGITNLLEKTVVSRRQKRLRAVYERRSAKYLVGADTPFFTDEELEKWQADL